MISALPTIAGPSALGGASGTLATRSGMTRCRRRRGRPEFSDSHRSRAGNPQTGTTFVETKTGFDAISRPKTTTLPAEPNNTPSSTTMGYTQMSTTATNRKHPATPLRFPDRMC